MWNQPYLETCCRAALHRLVQAGAGGRPEGLVDQPCLVRLQGMGLAAPREDAARFVATAAGLARHRSEVLKSPSS